MHRPRVRDPARRHHEREPGIGDQHDRRAHEVEAEAQTEMHQRMELPPAVVVGVEEEGLGEEEQHVRKKRGGEHAHQVVRELRIQDDEHERQERAEGRGEREGDREQLRELVREPVVSHISGLVADRLDDEREDRDGKDERREQQVELRDRPDGDAASDDREGAVLGLHVGLGLGLGLRVGLLGGQSLRARRRVDGRGRRPVRLPVLACDHETDAIHHDHGEHHEAGDGTEQDQQLCGSSRRSSRAPSLAASAFARVLGGGARRVRPRRLPAACARALARRR